MFKKIKSFFSLKASDYEETSVTSEQHEPTAITNDFFPKVKKPNLTSQDAIQETEDENTLSFFLGSHYQLVGDFHEKFDLPFYSSTKRGPTLVDAKTFKFRYEFLIEEIEELAEAYRNNDLVKISDSLADIVYIALGTAHHFNIPFDEIFEAVHDANMKKERSSGINDPRNTRKSALNIVKPEGWVSPEEEINTILEIEGYEPPAKTLRKRKFTDYIDPEFFVRNEKVKKASVKNATKKTRGRPKKVLLG